MYNFFWSLISLPISFKCGWNTCAFFQNIWKCRHRNQQVLFLLAVLPGQARIWSQIISVVEFPMCKSFFLLFRSLDEKFLYLRILGKPYTEIPRYYIKATLIINFSLKMENHHFSSWIQSVQLLHMNLNRSTMQNGLHVLPSVKISSLVKGTRRISLKEQREIKFSFKW